MAVMGIIDMSDMNEVKFGNSIISVQVDGNLIGDIRFVNGEWCFDHVVAEQKEMYHDKCVLNYSILYKILNKLKELNNNKILLDIDGEQQS